MAPGLFIITISLYLVSVVAGLIAAFFVKHISSRFINTLIIFHVLVFIFWFFMRNENDSVNLPGNSNYLFLVFFCSGVFIAGMLIRSAYPLYLKIYFGIYLLSLLVFVFAPSRMLGFAASGTLNAINPDRMHISENYFFVEQQSLQGKISNTTSSKMFKLVREMGMFHKTIARDILIPMNRDSVKLIDARLDELVQVRVYFKEKGIPDSLELHIPVGNFRKEGKIEQKRKQ
jgi:hypothetical protein